MKLASRRGGADGTLLLVSRDHARTTPAATAPTLREAFEQWEVAAARLAAEWAAFDADAAAGEALDPDTLAAPLPRAWQFLDGSAFLAHNNVLERAAGAAERTAADPPLMYQGMSDRFLAWNEPAAFRSEDDRIDFEAEFAVIVDRVPLGTSAVDALSHVKLVLLLNDWSLRAFGRMEMQAGFGFIHAKPPSSCAPVALAPALLGDAWRDGRVHLTVRVDRDGARFGAPHGGEMTYGFGDLIAHAARTRDLCAGTLIGSGTIANLDADAVGSACIAERRALETLRGGATTPFMRFGERVRIEALDAAGASVFGAIDQPVVAR